MGGKKHDNSTKFAAIRRIDIATANVCVCVHTTTIYGIFLRIPPSVMYAARPARGQPCPAHQTGLRRLPSPTSSEGAGKPCVGFYLPPRILLLAWLLLGLQSIESIAIEGKKERRKGSWRGVFNQLTGLSTAALRLTLITCALISLISVQRAPSATSVLRDTTGSSYTGTLLYFLLH